MIVNKKTRLARVPKDVLMDLRKKIPNSNDATRFRMLYDYSLFKAEKVLSDKNFTNKLGGFIYGNDLWRKAVINDKKIKQKR